MADGSEPASPGSEPSAISYQPSTTRQDDSLQDEVIAQANAGEGRDVDGDAVDARLDRRQDRELRPVPRQPPDQRVVQVDEVRGDLPAHLRAQDLDAGAFDGQLPL